MQDLTDKKNNEDSKRGKMIIEKLLNGKFKLGIKNNIAVDDNDITTLPRQNGKISVTFTERTFPTPARESYYLQEQEVIGVKY